MKTEVQIWCNTIDPINEQVSRFREENVRHIRVYHKKELTVKRNRRKHRTVDLIESKEMGG